MMDYKKAGVDIDKAAKAKKEIKKLVKATYNKNVISGVGLFGALYELKGYKNPVLVSSVDTLGTKIKLAFMTNKHDTIGMDIVGHCVNDIIVQGATPLFFMDYLPMHTMKPSVVKQVMKGLAKACKQNNISLVGGDTPEMPELYHKNEYDLAGFIVGVVEKNKIITGDRIKPGNIMIGLKSDGLHTNGYTLARKILLKKKDKKIIKELMKPHKIYLKDVQKLKNIDIKGMAHITGGGLLENIPRILPENCAAEIDVNWKIPKIFKLIQEKGKVHEKEMFRAFNMGIGFVLVVNKKDAGKVLKKIKNSLIIGKVTRSRINTITLA